ncbi:MFS transporter [Leeia oryzae]|uniref:MFS transporter n=1 Tax=Leeia oryzae TaxID=356662 RepID=UPI00036DD038|nr:MFS transporter [Leeia oryzae]
MKHILKHTPAEPTSAGRFSAPVRWVLVSLSLSMLMSSLGTSIANVALPTLVGVFGVTFQQVQWVVLAYLLAITTLIVSVGRLGDLLGHRRLLLWGISLFTVASIVGGSFSYGVLIAARVVQGVGAAIMMALSMAFVADTVPKDRTGRAMGLLGTMSAMGTALGPSLGGMLIASLGWRAIFWVNVPLGIVAWILTLRHLPADSEHAKPRLTDFDGIGTMLLAVTLAAYALGMTMGRGHWGAQNIVLLLLAGAGLAVFLLAETRVNSPLIRLVMLRDPVLSAGLVMSALVSTVLMATLVVGPFYLSHALLLDTAVVGLVMSSGPIVSALSGVPAGYVVDRFGAKNMVALGLTGILAGTGMLALLPVSLGIAGYVLPIMVTTYGYALFQAANNTMVMTGIPAGQRGSISGLLNLFRNLGLITGASVMGAIYAIAAGETGTLTVQPEAVAAGLHLTFGVAAVLMVVALVVALWGRGIMLQPRVEPKGE